MPSHNPVFAEQVLPQEQPLPQTKVCPACQSPLIPDGTVCTRCRWWARAAPTATFVQTAFHEGADSVQNTTLAPEPFVYDDDDIRADSAYQTTHSTYLTKPASSTFSSPIRSPLLSPDHLPSFVRPETAPRDHPHIPTSPCPRTDITRMRMRPQVHYCLYPGAIFQGTQKSGRNSYDVTVTIVDVDFSSSFLCGYLRIRGLTDDWPELTTYFDAEIIGSRYGFLTQNWGATEEEDLVHWGRFPAFRHVRSELRKPLLKIPDRDRGAVFMRWKERFLVPEHRVQDINGASFAGFYYICVDFNPPPPSPSRLTSQHKEIMDIPSLAKAETTSRARRNSRVQCMDQVTVGGLHASTQAVTMSGFYYHQNSEPYQQLSLSHVPERTRASFEFR